MTYFDDQTPVQPLVRAGHLLKAQAAARPDPRLMLLASAGFAVSGLMLALIILMGIGYASLNPRAAEATPPQDPRLIPYGQVSGPDIVEAVPLRDEEGHYIGQKP
jgi:hypothetical protein